MPVCLIAVGSNQGDCRALILAARAEIGGLANTRLLKMSTLLETVPVGPASNKFLNGCLLIETSRSPEQLMHDLPAIETALGRKRLETLLLDRSIDLDVLLYDEQMVCSEIALIPHPRMSFRRFVLEPAVEIAAGMRHPLFDASIDELLARVQRPGKLILVALPAPLWRVRNALPKRLDGWSIEFIDPFRADDRLDALLNSANLLIEAVDAPVERCGLWRPDYRGPRWQIGSVPDEDSAGKFESRIRTAIQSMGPLEPPGVGTEPSTSAL